jgi:hypothetical protein
VFDGVEEVSELASRFGRCDFRHGIRLSDSMLDWKDVPVAIRPYPRPRSQLPTEEGGT